MSQMGTEYQDAGAAGAIVTFIAMLKMKLPDNLRKWLPLFAVGLGVLYGALLRQSGGLFPSLLSGAYSGLAAVGMQDGAKVTMRKK